MKKTLLLFFLLMPLTARTEVCIDWARNMTKFDIDKASPSKRAIVLYQFEDFTKISGDDWLSSGIPMLLADYLNTARDINALFGPYALYSEAAKNPEYTVTGMFQRVKDNLRIFVKLNKGGELLKQWQMVVPYPENKQLFASIGDTAIAIMAMLSPRYDNEAFNRIKSSTPSIRAYENYVRGRLGYWEFNPDKFDIVKTWFDESKKADINYQNAYAGMADLYIFMALYNKQYRKAYSEYLEQAEKEFVAADKFLMRPPLPDLPRKYVIKARKGVKRPANRFLVSNTYFVAGLNAAGRGQWLEAAKQFENAVKEAPEDAITWYHLSEMRQKTGDTARASEARAKALEINRCLQ